ALPSVPAFDPERLLPPALRAWVVDIAERAQCPIELAAVSAMTVVATVVGRQIGIRPKRHDHWTVIPNLWALGIGPPGILTTHALAEPKKPLAALIKAARAGYAEKVTAYELAVADLKAQQDALKGRLRSAYKSKKLDEAGRIREELAALKKQELTKPTERR